MLAAVLSTYRSHSREVFLRLHQQEDIEAHPFQRGTVGSLGPTGKGEERMGACREGRFYTPSLSAYIHILNSIDSLFNSKIERKESKNHSDEFYYTFVRRTR